MANKRNIFIINPYFQYKLSFIICSLVVLGSLIFPVTIWDLFDKFIASQPGNASRYEESRTSLLILLGLIELGILGIVFVISIFLTHKVAGPLYKLGNYLYEVRSGGANYPLSFRNGDYFHEIAEELNLTLEYLRNKQEDEIDYLEEISAYIENISLVVPQDKKPVLDEIRMKINEIVEIHNLRN